MASNTQYVPPVEKFTDTDEFREKAIVFLKHGMFTQSPKGTDAYNEVWDNEVPRFTYH